MVNLERICWVIVECACRILGISTAAVLCTVGVETLRQGEFHSLAIYLLVSSAGMLLFEMAFFLDAMLNMCLPCPPGWKVFVLWKKMASLGSFQKFLYYSIMSVVCFLHPVLVWHAVIPGTMLLVTAFFNFILSKKPGTASPKGPQENYNDTGLTTVCVAERGGSESTFSFLHMATGRRGGSLAFAPRANGHHPGGRGGESTQAMLELEDTSALKSRERERRRMKERRETGDIDGYEESEPETTSDTAPMISD
ncbi:transmembrane protein 72 [Aplochiton taeniatus]